MTKDHENISDIRKIISKINYKLNKMKDNSSDVLSKNDTDEFFQQFLDLCTNKDTIDKTNVQQTFFDKIKNWYKKFLGENRNINLDEFKFINEEAKILTESVCNKEDYETIKNIFLTWKKGFNYNFKNKFNLDIDFIQTELKSIELILSKIDKQSYFNKITSDLSTPKIFAASKPQQSIKPSVKPEIIPTQSNISSSKAETTPPSLNPEIVSSSTPEKTISVPIEKNILNLASAIENLGFKNDDKLQNSIRNIINSKRTKELVNLINTQDTKDIKLFLGL